MIILYLLVGGISVFFGYNIYKRYQLIKLVASCAKEIPSMPLITTGKALKAFTIEKTMMVTASKTISIDFISYIATVLFGKLGLSFGKVHDTYLAFAKVLCYQQLMSQSDIIGANYLVNIHQTIKMVGRCKIHIFIYGNAIFRYQDTLPIFNLGDGNASITNTVTLPFLRKTMINMSAAFILMVVVLITLVNTFDNMLVNRLVKDFTLNEEEILWSCIKDDFDNKRLAGRVDLINAEKELQDLLDGIPAVGGKYKFTIYISHQDDSNVILYPAGNIVMTEGFAKNLKTQNQAVFILSHMINHYNNKDHIKALADKIINLKAIISLFGENSMIGKALVWKSDFYNDFSSSQEAESDKFAASVANDLYGDKSGRGVDVSFADKQFKKAHSALCLRHAAPDPSMSSKGEDESALVPLNYRIGGADTNSHAAIVRHDLNEDFIGVFNNYRMAIDQEYIAYNAFLAPFNNITQFYDKATEAELNVKQNLLLEGISNIKQYKSNFHQVVSQYDREIESIIAFQKDDEQKKILQQMWQQEKEGINNSMNFYLERDYQVLQNQLIIVKFLNARHSSYSINKGRIEFQTEKEKSDYDTLVKRVDEILKRTPPNNNLISDQ